MSLIDLGAKFTEIKKAVESVPFVDVELSDSFKNEYEKYIAEKSANGYESIEWAKHSAKISTSSGKSIYLTNYWFYIASELASYMDSLLAHKKTFIDIFSGSDLQSVANSCRKGISEEYKKRIKDYFEQKELSDSDYKYFLTFLSDYQSWGGGKTIDRNDFYVSPILQAGNLLAETQSAIAEIAKQFSESSSLKDNFNPVFLTKTKAEKKSTVLISNNQIASFIYELLDYLNKNHELKPLINCLVEKNQSLGNFNLELDGHRLTSIFKVSDEELSESQLTRGDKLRFFSDPLKIGGYHYYVSNQWTDGTGSRLDLQSFIPIFNKIFSNYRIVKKGQQYTLLSLSNNFKPTQVFKSFLLFAGISGTGKTRFIREQAKATGAINETYCLTSVRPDWHEPSDLLGYISSLNVKEYRTTDVLEFILKAWRAILDAGLELKVEFIDGHGDTLVVAGEQDELNNISPFWLCLDEMNLAPVEQYFADYLSVLETIAWRWEDGVFTYSSDSLLKSSTISQIKDKVTLRKTLGFEKTDYDDAWDLFSKYGIGIPFNLIVAGTVNMDETTHGFSRKVIDRALSFDFGEFFPNIFSEFFEPSTSPKSLTYPIWSQADKDSLANTCDPDGERTIKFLETINEKLDGTPFKLAYRALNEVLLSVIANSPKTDQELLAVWDDFVMCKLLPRIEGDLDKLSSKEDNKSLLQVLSEALAHAGMLGLIWDELKDSPNARPDLYREKTEGDDKVIRIPCRSREKLDWMQARLERDTFTSFWP